MRNIATIISATIAATSTALADVTPVDEAYKGAAIHIVTAHECSKITGDTERKTVAISLSKRRLLSAGYSEKEANDAIQGIVAKLSDQPSKTTKQVCEMILSRWEKAP